ncbi:MAG: GNAT family N-acetyltransferase [Chthoniobacteraceae bacterium]
MPDLLVRLYALPPPAAAQIRGIEIRRALVPEKHRVVEWVRATFNRAWASEAEVAFARQPVACFLAVQDGAIAGFCAYEATCRNFLGPLGVAEHARGSGIGAALLLSALQAMAAEGYAYAIIGGAGPTAFFERVAGAQVIPDSTPGMYRGLLRSNPPETK